VIDRRVLPNGEVEEWERTSTIPDDFIYDPETHSYYPPGEPVTWDIAAEMRDFEEARQRGDFKTNFTEEELQLNWTPRQRAKGRKSLGGGAKKKEQLELFSGLSDDDSDAGDLQATEHDEDRESDDGESSDDVS
jgi:hypothetical protein